MTTNIIIQFSQDEFKELIRNCITESLENSNLTQAQPTDKLFNVKEASRFLDLAPQTVYGYTSNRAIPFIKRGKKLYFRKSDLENWLSEGRKQTKEEMQASPGKKKKEVSMDNPGITPNSMQDKNTKISYYDNLTGKGESVIHLSDLFRIIQRGGSQYEIIKQLRGETDPVKATKLKKKLPVVTPSGLYYGNRRLENLQQYSGFICLDFDNVIDISNATNLVNLDPYCYAVFISPSGKGIKLFVKVGCNQNDHAKTFNSLCYYYSQKYNLEADKSCKDIGRLMFLSYDPQLFLNENSIVWSSENSHQFKFNLALANLEKKENFQKGNRNNFIFKLASACSRHHIEREYCLQSIKGEYLDTDFLEEEITKTVNSAYNSIGNKPLIIQDSLPTETPSLCARVEKYLLSKYDIRLNEVSGKIELRIKHTNSTYVELNENSIFRELEHKHLHISLSKLTSLLQSDFVSRYNPFKDYFESLGSWSDFEPDYILNLAKYLPVKDRERFNKHLKKMLVRCIACALDDAVFNKQVFILVHDQQNSGKSTFFRWLCPPALREYLAENINTDKDSIIALATNFLINMDELATLSKTEINGLKSFISKDRVNVRLPYGRRAVTMPRRASFIGSTNKDEFLTDETGSVRWLCFELIGNIDFAYKDDIDINDIWRQAFALYKGGFQYQLTSQEIAENEGANRDFQVLTFESEIIPKLYSPSSKEAGGQFITATDIFQKIGKADLMISNKCNKQSIGKAMKMLGFKRESKYREGKNYSEKGYYAIEL